MEELEAGVLRNGIPITPADDDSDRYLLSTASLSGPVGAYAGYYQDPNLGTLVVKRDGGT